MNTFYYKKEYGQNFINDDKIIFNILEKVTIKESDLVIEIGPGMGILSTQIIPKSKFTILYEIDKRLEKILNDKLKYYKNYKLIISDFLECDLKKEIENIDYDRLTVIANLPYYITTPIIKKLINEVYPDEITVMVQKEVGNRFCAKPGGREYGYFTVYLNSYYSTEKLFDVKKECFTPVPKVDSCIVHFKRNKKEIINDNNFNKLIEDAFKYKRKNLRNNWQEYNLEIINNILKEKGFSLQSRAEEIPIDLFIEISNRIFK